MQAGREIRPKVRQVRATASIYYDERGQPKRASEQVTDPEIQKHNSRV
jgi:hypothetical protein